MPLPPALPVAPISEERTATLSLAIRFFSDSVACFISDRGQTIWAVHENLPTQPWDEQDSSAFSSLLDRNPFLTYPYRSVHVSFTPNAFALIPQGMSDPEGCDESWLLPWLLKLNNATYIDTYLIGRGQPSLAIAWNRELYHFLRRTYSTACIEPITLSHIKKALHYSRGTGDYSIDLLIDGTEVDLIAVQNHNIQLLNRYSIEATHDEEEDYSTSLLYYLTAYTNFIHSKSIIGDPLDIDIRLHYLPHQWHFSSVPLPTLSQEFQHTNYQYDALPMSLIFHE